MRALILVVFAVLTACGPASTGRHTPVPHEEQPCWPEEIGDTYCDDGTALVCESTIDPAVYLWLHSGSCR